MLLDILGVCILGYWRCLIGVIGGRSIKKVMLYAIISQDVDDSLEKRMLARPAHIKRLEVLKNQGHLILAGPHPAIDTNEPGEAGFTGSLVVAEFDSLEVAKVWANADPYIKSGAYVSVIVKPFKKALP